MSFSLNPRDNRLIAFFLILGLSVLGCALLLGLRVLISGRFSYLYLLQNIVLAFIPFLIAAVMAVILAHIGSRSLKAAILAPAAVLWLLFYPNAPYIFTDFIHVINKVYLRVSPSEWIGLNALIWYDTVMTAAFAFIGHFIGLASMWIMQSLMSAVWGKWASRIFLGLAVVLAGFGIYLGRFSRLNSWDAIFSPFKVAGEVMDAFADPKSIFFSLVFALFILLSYGALWSFKSLSLPKDAETKA